MIPSEFGPRTPWAVQQCPGLASGTKSPLLVAQIPSPASAITVAALLARGYWHARTLHVLVSNTGNNRTRSCSDDASYGTKPPLSARLNHPRNGFAWMEVMGRCTPNTHRCSRHICMSRELKTERHKRWQGRWATNLRKPCGQCRRVVQ